MKRAFGALSLAAAPRSAGRRATLRAFDPSSTPYSASKSCRAPFAINQVAAISERSARNASPMARARWQACPGGHRKLANRSRGRTPIDPRVAARPLDASTAWPCGPAPLPWLLIWLPLGHVSRPGRKTKPPARIAACAWGKRTRTMLRLEGRGWCQTRLDRR